MVSRGSLRSSHMLLLPLALMSGFWQHAHGLGQTYCSSQNTGSNFDAVTDIYQSNGACQKTCVDNYAFAIVQYQQCWCSNYAPADQVDVSECNQSCPGYPDDKCGDKDNGLYGYIKLNNSPSGTLGSGSASSSTSSAAQSSTQQSTPTSSPSPSSAPASSPVQSDTTVFTSVPVTVTVKQSASVVVSYVTPSSSTPTTTSSSTSSTSSTPSSTSSSTSSTSTSFSLTSTQAAVITSSPSSTAADTDSLSHTTLVSTRVVTLSGAPVTQTVTSTAVVTPGAGSLHENESKGVSGGTVAGAVVGSVAGVALLLAGAFFLWRRKQSETSDPESPRSGSGSGSTRRRMERNTSVLSKTGLLSSAGTAVDMEKFQDDAGQGHRYHGSESTAPTSTSPDGDRRNSRPLIYDQRLNPAALMEHWERNGSRASIGTMQDQRDYSRPLGVTNPDPVDD
ncbi:hypothetical protein KCU81_g1035, partial [Aureobasidium melanogenum]|uniref:WSC domain-containing protein n=1 Tax=Aureobasidium melanogenum (strain CBS 110374) TaxID=1043003 RepID=A0A074W0Z0_AURM1